MDVCCRAADVYDDNFADALVQKLRRLHDCARGRNDWAIYHVADVFHSRGICYVLLKGILNNFSAGLYI